MKKISVKELFKQGEQYLEQKVVVEGWVRTNRDQKEFGFLNLNDGSYLENVQVVYDQSISNFEEVKKQFQAMMEKHKIRYNESNASHLAV